MRLTSCRKPSLPSSELTSSPQQTGGDGTRAGAGLMNVVEEHTVQACFGGVYIFTFFLLSYRVIHSLITEREVTSASSTQAKR